MAQEEDRPRRGAKLDHEGDHKNPYCKGTGVGTSKRAEGRATKRRGEEAAKLEILEKVLEGGVGCGSPL